MDNWTDALPQEIPIDVVYLDFSKTFDSVPHQRLLVLEQLKFNCQSFDHFQELRYLAGVECSHSGLKFDKRSQYHQQTVVMVSE